MQAAAQSGVHGLHDWLKTLTELIAVEPKPASLPDALEPVRGIIDVERVLQAVERHLNAPQGAWHPEDWRNSHPELPDKFALAMFVYTLQDPNVYAPLGDALHGPDRASGPGGISVRVRAWLPFAKLLDMALVEAALIWEYFIGQTFRGVKYAFPKPTVAEHDPVKYFPKDRDLHWFEFNSSSTEFEVMYRDHFCGKSGPRTVFTVQSCEGVSIRRFSHFPDEEEVLFRPGAHFRVMASVKKLRAADLGDNPPVDGGFPDDVHLQHVPTDPIMQLEATRERLRSVSARCVELEQEVADARAEEVVARVARAEEHQRAEERMEAQLAEMREQMGALTQALDQEKGGRRREDQFSREEIRRLTRELEEERERRRQVETTLDAVLRERVPARRCPGSCC